MALTQNLKILFMDIIISNLVIFGYNNIHYEIKEGCNLSQVSKNLGSAW